jgi:hypothetical protein
MADGNFQQSIFRMPVVRHFIACERIETAAGGSRYTLANVIHAIKPVPEAVYPCIHPQLSLFVQMTDGRGKLSFRVQLIFLDVLDEEKSTHTSAPVILDLGNDPLIVHGWPIRLKNVLFERPGLYEFRLLCGAHVIAREAMVLRESS